MTSPDMQIGDDGHDDEVDLDGRDGGRRGFGYSDWATSIAKIRVRDYSY
jgi:hypothetical protein